MRSDATRKKADARAPSSGTPRYRAARFVHPYAKRLAFVFAIMILSTFLGLLNPWFVQQLIDRILLESRVDLLWVFGAAILGVALFRFGMSVLQSYVYAGVTAQILLDMRRDFLQHLQTLSLRFFSGARFGDIITRFNRDLSRLQEISTGALLGFLSSVLTLVGTVCWALYYDWSLFLIAALPFPLALLVARPFRGPIRNLTERLRALSAQLASTVVESITGIRTVRSFGREKRELRKFVGKGHEMIRAILSFQLTNAFASGLPRTLVVVASVIVYTVGGLRVIRQEMGLGSLVALSMYVGMIYQPLVSIVEYYLQLVQARVSLERVREIRELAPEVVEDPDAPAPGPLRGHVRFHDVRFRHRADQPLLEGVDFEIAAGETVALVGPSGSGKSTVADLLFRFLDPAAGRVTIDGHDLRAIDMRRMRRGMAVVSQDAFLFHDTLYENVRYGSPGANREDVERAAAAAGVDAMAAGMPDGMETVVGERGEQLSAGQRQRVSIARALLRRPKLLILDEATSALDVSADRAVRRAIDELVGDATTLLISHRPTSLIDVDRILVLEGGTVREEVETANEL